jgi:hypothetical protein
MVEDWQAGRRTGVNDEYGQGQFADERGMSATLLAKTPAGMMAGAYQGCFHYVATIDCVANPCCIARSKNGLLIFGAGYCRLATE